MLAERVVSVYLVWYKGTHLLITKLYQPRINTVIMITGIVLYLLIVAAMAYASHLKNNMNRWR